ncbi:MAG: hypothetical protein SVW02_01160 [Candidatus Nanohaloarchaea archaeon]|nr:hypothetical protein [Candidatus Nanohaloarchaea archaeon]
MAINKVDDVALYLERDEGGRTPVDAAEVRDMYYAPLEEELPEHEPVRPPSSRLGAPERAQRWHQEQEEARKAYDEWADTVRRNPVVAEVYTDDGTEEYRVWPRMDISFAEMNTSPNVFFFYDRGVDPVEDDSVPDYVVRQWANYGEDVIRQLDSCPDSPLNRNDHDDYLFAEMGTSRFPSIARNGGLERGEYVVVPEVFMETAFHREGGVYDQLTGSREGAPVTPPNIKAVDRDEAGSVYVLRPFRAPAFSERLADLPRSYAERMADFVGTYYGTRSGLGMLGCFDEFAKVNIGTQVDVEHFWDVWQDGPVIVDGDPEYVAVTANDGWHEGEDWARFRKNRLEHQANVPGWFINRVMDRRREVEADLDDLDVLEFIPEEADPSLLPDEKRVSSL